MTTTILQQAQQAELALAAYANLNTSNQSKALTDAGFSVAQTDQFIARYSVIAQYNVDSGTGVGLSATVFEEKTPDSNGINKRYLAIRGSDDRVDFLSDVINVALLGGTKYQGQYQALKAKVSAWQADGTLPDGIRTGQQQFTVSGHSLGGFMSVALTADFAKTIEHTYLYTVPGTVVAGVSLSSGATQWGAQVLNLGPSAPHENHTGITLTSTGYIAGPGYQGNYIEAAPVGLGNATTVGDKGNDTITGGGRHQLHRNRGRQRSGCPGSGRQHPNRRRGQGHRLRGQRRHPLGKLR